MNSTLVKVLSVPVFGFAIVGAASVRTVYKNLWQNDVHQKLFLNMCESGDELDMNRAAEAYEKHFACACHRSEIEK